VTRRVATAASAGLGEPAAPLRVDERRPPGGHHPPDVPSRPAAILLLVLLAVVWGVHWAVVKIGLEYIPPFTYGALRVVTGWATIVALLAWQGRLRRPDRASAPIIVSVGLVQVAAGIVIMNLALLVVPAGRSSVLTYTMPLWVAVLLAVAFGTRPRIHELVGLALGLVGLAALLGPATVDWQAPGELAGSLALVANAVLWAAVTIHIRRHRWTRSPLELQPWQLLLALVPLVALAVWLEPAAPIRWEVPAVLALAYSGPLATAFATWAYQSITRSLGAQASATGFLAVPVVGLASGAVLLGEPLGPLDVAGIAFILGGVAMTTLPRDDQDAAGRV
jgi:drug/metabolite transporter (DMT)-like permease